jgi:hypothetical protein
MHPLGHVQGSSPNTAHASLLVLYHLSNRVDCTVCVIHRLSRFPEWDELCAMAWGKQAMLQGFKLLGLLTTKQRVAC